MTIFRLLLVALAALRLTRLFTSDMLGEWAIVGPLKRWAARREAPDDIRDDLEKRFSHEIRDGRPVGNPPPRWGWRSKAVKGFDCPFCVGFWLGALVLVGEALFARRRGIGTLWTLALGALGLNYVTGHVSKRIDG